MTRSSELCHEASSGVDALAGRGYRHRSAASSLRDWGRTSRVIAAGRAEGKRAGIESGDGTHGSLPT